MGQPLGPTADPPRPITIEYVKELEKETNLERKYDIPAGKDTLTLPNNGYVVIRFRANNPGKNKNNKEVLLDLHENSIVIIFLFLLVIKAFGCSIVILSITKTPVCS